MKQPWLKFYSSDWRSDVTLGTCSLAARGLWMEMLCVMSEASPRGSLSKSGGPYTAAQIAALARASTKEVEKLLKELEREGVFSRDNDGTIYSRRMRRDIFKAEMDKANGKAGGNPNLKRGVNPPDKAQKPEARSQKPDPSIPNRSASTDLRVGVVKAFEKANIPIIPDTSRVDVWLAQGYDSDLILAVIGTVLATNRNVRSLTYFDQALERARQTTIPSEQRKSKAADQTEPRIDFGGGYSAPYSSIRQFWGKGQWIDHWGPRPDQPGCRISPEVLAEIMGSVAA